MLQDEDRIHTLKLPAPYARNGIEMVQLSTDIMNQADRPNALKEEKRLFKRMHDTIYVQNFTEDERIPEERYLMRLTDSDMAIPVNITLLVQNRGKPNEQILAMAAASFFPKSGVALLPYAAREQLPKKDQPEPEKIQYESKGRALGGGETLSTKPLRDALFPWLDKIAKDKGTQLNGIVSESEVPGVQKDGTFSQDASQSMDQMRRLKVVTKMGGKIIPINYFQPPLDVDKKPVACVLFSYPIPGKHGKHADVKALKAWLPEFMEALKEPLDSQVYTVPAGQLQTLGEGKWPPLDDKMKDVVRVPELAQNISPSFRELKPRAADLVQRDGPYANKFTPGTREHMTPKDPSR
jgi:hypothetical protein